MHPFRALISYGWHRKVDCGRIRILTSLLTLVEAKLTGCFTRPFGCLQWQAGHWNWLLVSPIPRKITEKESCVTTFLPILMINLNVFWRLVFFHLFVHKKIVFPMNQHVRILGYLSKVTVPQPDRFQLHWRYYCRFEQSKNVPQNETESFPYFISN